jgi:hypothetical protein
MARNILAGVVIGIALGLLAATPSGGDGAVVISAVIAGALFGAVAGVMVCLLKIRPAR